MVQSKGVGMARSSSKFVGLSQHISEHSAKDQTGGGEEREGRGRSTGRVTEPVSMGHIRVGRHGHGPSISNGGVLVR